MNDWLVSKIVDELIRRDALALFPGSPVGFGLRPAGK